MKSNEISLPVHVGQSDVLVPMAKPKPCSEYHGKDGFGDVADFYPTMNDVDMDNLKSETAVQARDLDFTVILTPRAQRIFPFHTSLILSSN